MTSRLATTRRSRLSRARKMVFSRRFSVRRTQPGVPMLINWSAIACLCLRVLAHGSVVGAKDSCLPYVNSSSPTPGFVFPVGNGSTVPVNCQLSLNSSTSFYITFNVVSLIGEDYVAVFDSHGNVIANYSNIKDEKFVVAGLNATIQIFTQANYTNSSIHVSYSTECVITYSYHVTEPVYGTVSPSQPLDCRYVREAKLQYEPLALSFTKFNVTQGYLAVVEANNNVTKETYSGTAPVPDVLRIISSGFALRLVITSSGQSFAAIAANTTSGCTDTITVSSTTEFKYPYLSPKGYDNSLNCRWLVRTANPSHKLLVNVTMLDLADDLDLLTVGDGISSRTLASSVALRHNDAIGSVFVMDGGSTYLQFVTDESGSRRGFSITFISQAFGGKYLYNGSIVLQTTGKDGCFQNPVDESCDTYYLLQAEENMQIVLQFVNESILYGQSIMIYDGATVLSPLLAVFLTTSPLPPVASSGKDMLIVSRSFSNYSMSFVATFEQQQAGRSRSSWLPSDTVRISTLLKDANDIVFWFINPSISSATGNYAVVRLLLDQLIVPDGVKGAIFSGANKILDLNDVDLELLPLSLDAESGTGIWCVFKQDGSLNGTASSLISFAASYAVANETTVLTRASGAISSPNFPGFYPVDGRYNWTLTLPPLKTMHIKFDQFNLAPGHRLSAYSVERGSSDSSVQTVLQWWEGTTRPNDFIYRNREANGSVLFGLYLDATLVHGSPLAVATGFSFYYEILDCGDVVINSTYIRTPDYPYPVNKSLACLWIIDVPAMADNMGSVNILNFTVLLIGAVNDTNIYIRDGGSYDSPLMSLPLADGQSVNTLSSRNLLWIEYNFAAAAVQPNSSVPGAAFSLSYLRQACNESNQCDDNLCIHQSWRCDGIPHCRDGRDEQGCGPSCPLQPVPQQSQGVAYWVLGVSLGGALLLGIVLAVAFPPLYRRCRYRNYGELRDMMAPVPT